MIKKFAIQPNVAGEISSQADGMNELSQIHVVSASKAPSELFRAWNQLRNANPLLVSPYFDPEFTKAVARVRPDVEIAYAVSDRRIVAILPFQTNGDELRPVGGRINDVHGIVSRGNELSLLANWVMLEKSKSRFGLHAAINTDSEFESYQFERLKSYHLDLSDGFEAYRTWVRKNSSTVARQGQKTRGLVRDHGELRFEFDSGDADLLEELIRLKREKYQRSRTFDILSVDWAANLLREIRQVRQPGFQGLLSAIYAGEKLVAVHFGMLTDSILHYWFPVFDPAFSRYSPGTELMLRVAEAAADAGVTKLDLGYGDDPYKLKFSNGIESVTCGKITSNRLAYHLAKKRYQLRMKLKQIPMKPMAKVVLRSVFPKFGYWNYQ